jgi:hypothetical protein
MEDKQDNERLIGKLIKKRKAENEAFVKLLNAIEGKGLALDGAPKNKRNQKSK